MDGQMDKNRNSLRRENLRKLREVDALSQEDVAHLAGNCISGLVWGEA